jgi:hypothetical protein
MKRVAERCSRASAFAVGLVVAVLGSASPAGDGGGLYERLTGADREARIRAAHEIERTWQEESTGIIKAATACLGAETRGDRCAEAIGVLGDLRAAEAAPLLIANLLYWPAAERGEEASGAATPLMEAYPCAGALAKIGMPALPGLVREAGAHESRQYQQVAARVLREVLGTLAEQYVRENAPGAESEHFRRFVEILEKTK